MTTFELARRCSTLLERARRGDASVLARLLTYVQDAGDEARAISAILVGAQRQSAVIGVTGAPGAGKSTLTSALVAELRNAGRRVAVLAVDPSSPIGGGAVLGDRIRMQEHARDAGVFIRSFATRGELGGLAVGVPQAVRLLEAVGFEAVIVETVGVGQSEIDVRWLVDTAVLVLAPGMGDSVQAAKAGIVEVADVFAVNKGDLPGADVLVRQMRDAIRLGASAADGWRSEVVKVTATTAEGIPELVAAIEAHRSWLATSGGRAARRQVHARLELLAICAHRVRRRLSSERVRPSLEEATRSVANAESDPYAAADALLLLIERQTR